MYYKLHDCFPTTWSFIVFLLYMILFINQGILVTATKEKQSNHYGYNTVTVVMLIECLKLFVSSAIYLKEFSVRKLFDDIFVNSKVLLLYFVPAILYTLYNNLTFVNLSVFDPTTYYLLLQFRVVVTGIVFQLLFKKRLSRKQWMSLVLLTLGCIIKEVSAHNSTTTGDGFTLSSQINIYLVLVLVQVFCSCFAGVYNEYLLKDAGANVHIMLQNVFMYIDCILCNLLFLLFKGDIVSVFSNESLSSVWHLSIIAVIVNGAACGILTSLFLKNLNSIMKTFASALELIFMAILCWMIFDIPVDAFTVLSIVIVSFATYLYLQNPVSNPPKTQTDTCEQKEKMIDNESAV